MKKEIKLLFTLFTILLFAFSCEEKESGDVTAPGSLTVDLNNAYKWWWNCFL